MGMVKEFKEFINRGNVLDLAVGVVIGAERLTWWYGFASGSNATGRRAAA